MALSNPFQRPHPRPFPSEGVSLSRVLDSKTKSTKAPWLRNLTIDADGAIVIRPGIKNKYSGVPPIANKTPVHTIRRISDKQTGNSAILYGVQDHLANDIGGVLTDLGGHFSGNPLSIIPWRPTQSALTHAYIYDDSLQAKIAVNSIFTQSIGVGPPSLPPVVELQKKGWAEIATTSSTTGWDTHTDGGVSGPGVIWNGDVILDTRINAVPITFFLIDDPAGPAGDTGMSWLPSDMTNMGVGAILQITGTGSGGPYVSYEIVTEVYPATQTNTRILACNYDNGTTGLCTIQPARWSEQYTRNAVVEIIGATTEKLRIIECVQGFDGSWCFRVNAQNFHILGDTLQILGSFRVEPSGTYTGFHAPYTISSFGIEVSNVSSGGAAGQGWTDLPLSPPLDMSRISTAAGVMGGNGQALTVNDYMHLSTKCVDWTNIQMVRVLLGIQGDGSVDKNAYYYEIEQSILVAAATGSQTVTQVTRSGNGLLANPAIGRFPYNKTIVPIDSGDDSGSFSPFTIPSDQLPTSGGSGLNPFPGGPGPASSTSGNPLPSAQSGTGSNQWGEIVWNVGSMFRIGSDPSKTLSAVDVIRIEVTFITPAVDTSVSFGSLTMFGGDGPDIGGIGTPYSYRYCYRDSLTGARSDYSPDTLTRYGLLAYRNNVLVQCTGNSNAGAASDKIDIERFGGLTGAWCYVGTIDDPGPATTTTFIDTIDDTTALQNLPLSDHRVIKPWVRRLGPIQSAANSIVSGSSLVDAGSIIPLNLIPGSLILVNGIATTFRRFLGAYTGGGVVVELTDSLGNLGGVRFNVPTPDVYGEPIGRVFGPFANCMFALDGTYVRWTEGNDPDVTHVNNYLEITDPTDVCVAGFVFNGRAGVLTTKRLFSIDGDPVNGFIATEVPYGKGAFTPYGLAVGPNIAWIARDGIYESDGNLPRSLTSADLSSIFPIEGRPGSDTNGTSAPVLSLSEQQYLRLQYLDDGSLMFTYRDNAQQYHQLRHVWAQDGRSRWFPYDYALPIGMFYAVDGDGQTGVLAGGADTPSGMVYTVGGSTNPTTDDGAGFICNIRPFLDDFDDPRSNKYVGDLIVDTDTGGLAGNIVATLFQDDMSVSTALGNIVQSPGRQQTRFDLNGGNGVRGRNFSLDLTWTTEANKTQRLYLYELSMLSRPETIGQRATDYELAGYEGDKFIQAIKITADTFGADKTLLLQYDGNQTGATITINHNGMLRDTYSVPVPYNARLVRIACSDNTPWELYDLEWIFNPEPPLAKMWWIQPTGFDITGYKHLPEIRPAFAAPSDVTMTLYADQTSYYTLDIGNTGGPNYDHMQRLNSLIVPAKKFKLWYASFSSSAPFRMYLKDMEVLVKGWSESGDYQVIRPIGDVHRTEGARA